MAKPTRKKILFFINGPKPSKAQQDVADKIMSEQNVFIHFRNADMEAMGGDSHLESCDGVLGKAVPNRYAEKYTKIDPNNSGSGTDSGKNSSGTTSKSSSGETKKS